MKAIKFAERGIKLQAPLVGPREKIGAALTSLWGTEPFIKIKKGYKGDAGNKRASGSFGACLRDQMVSGTAGATTYADCAKTADLGTKYAGHWP